MQTQKFNMAEFINNDQAWKVIQHGSAKRISMAWVNSQLCRANIYVYSFQWGQGQVKNKHAQYSTVYAQLQTNSAQKNSTMSQQNQTCMSQIWQRIFSNQVNLWKSKSCKSEN